MPISDIVDCTVTCSSFFDCSFSVSYWSLIQSSLNVNSFAKPKIEFRMSSSKYMIFRVVRLSVVGVPALSDPNDYSALWNAMIHPLLNMVINGAIWYQVLAQFITIM